jgi:HAD superfamily hydrolase (TIGR01509 family)
MDIRVILFDFGGVIWTPIDEMAVRTNRERLARDLGFEDMGLMWQYFYGGEEWRLTKVGRQTDTQMWSSLLKPLGLSTEVSQKAFVKELFQGVGLKPEMEKVLRALSEKYSLGILSNASDLLESLVHDELGIGDYFTSIVNSYRIGVAKPQHESYEIALDRLDAKPNEVFFVDDQPRNTVAAEALSIRSHVFTGVGDLRRDLIKMTLLTG